MSRVYILTLKLNPELQFKVNALRRRYFPPSINYLDAHITLFHALPEAQIEEWSGDVESLAIKQNLFEVTIDQPYPLGRGVGLKVIAPDIPKLHRDLQSRWQNFLTPQDRQKRNAHVTIQNKVSPEEAKQTLRDLLEGWTPEHGFALGICIYEYLGGPWRLKREILWSDREKPKLR